MHMHMHDVASIVRHKNKLVDSTQQDRVTWFEYTCSTRLKIVYMNYTNFWLTYI